MAINADIDTLINEINLSSVTGSKNAEAEHLCFKNLLKELMMFWYFLARFGPYIFTK